MRGGRRLVNICLWRFLSCTCFLRKVQSIWHSCSLNLLFLCFTPELHDNTFFFFSTIFSNKKPWDTWEGRHTCPVLSPVPKRDLLGFKRLTVSTGRLWQGGWHRPGRSAEHSGGSGTSFRQSPRSSPQVHLWDRHAAVSSSLHYVAKQLFDFTPLQNHEKRNIPVSTQFKWSFMLIFPLSFVCRKSFVGCCWSTTLPELRHVWTRSSLIKTLQRVLKHFNSSAHNMMWWSYSREITSSTLVLLESLFSKQILSVKNTKDIPVKFFAKVFLGVEHVQQLFFPLLCAPGSFCAAFTSRLCLL